MELRIPEFRKNKNKFLALFGGPFFYIIVVGVIYSSLLFSDSIVNPDAQIIYPNLGSFNDIFDYLHGLINLKTVDFQPMRDLSFAVDIFFYNKFGINVSIYQNVIIFGLTSYVLEKIISIEFPDILKQERILIVLCFLSYPLFSQMISWGVGRKHLLSCLFILLATYYWIKSSDIKKASVFYALSVLSQPISILWPLWALFYKWIKLHKNEVKTLTPVWIIFVTTLVINFLYYAHSPVFHASYADKTNEILEISDKILAVGHYSFQLLFPYFLSYSYSLGDYSTLIGLILFISTLLFMWKVRKDKISFLHWFVFLSLPLSVILVKSSLLLDIYLLIPLCGFLFFVLHIKKRIKSNLLFFYVGLFLVWGVLSFYGASTWRSELKLTERSFNNRPSCISASDYLMASYEEDHPKTDKKARDYLYDYECGKFQKTGEQLVFLQANLLLYENDFSDEMREERLKNLLQYGLYPYIALGSFYIQKKNELKATQVIEEMLLKYSESRFSGPYFPAAENILMPFCSSHNFKKCSDFLEPFVTKKQGLIYK